MDVLLEGRIELGGGDEVRGQCVLRHCMSAACEVSDRWGGGESERGSGNCSQHVGRGARAPVVKLACRYIYVCLAEVQGKLPGL